MRWHFFIKKLRALLTFNTLLFSPFFKLMKDTCKWSNPKSKFSFILSPLLSLISQLSLELQNWASKVFPLVIKFCLAPSFIFYTKTYSLLFESCIQFFGLLGIIPFNGTPSSVRIFFFFSFLGEFKPSFCIFLKPKTIVD